MKYCFIFLLCMSCFLNSQAKKLLFNITEPGNYLKALTDEYGNKPLVGLIFIDSVYAKSAVPMLALNKLPYCSYELAINNDANKKIALTRLAQDYLSKLAASKRQKVISKLEYWLKNDFLLLSILDNRLDENLYFDEIANSLPETKALLMKYLESPKQYFGSLDEDQSCHLYYDVLSYLLKLDDKKRISFFKRYFNSACDIALKAKK